MVYALTYYIQSVYKYTYICKLMWLHGKVMLVRFFMSYFSFHIFFMIYLS